jgi:threonine dehydrogenase-like Zn-dependent dehydrogenase
VGREEKAMKAKAMVVTEPYKIQLQEFEVVPPAKDQILVKTTVTSICSSDIKFFHGTFAACEYPLIMGHETAGVVHQIGDQAAEQYDLAVGDRITIEPYRMCGKCKDSRSEHFYHQCTHAGNYGVSLACDQPPHLFGGYSEYLYVLPGTVLHKLDDSVRPLAASLSSVVANGVRWVKTIGKVTLGEAVVISGPGSQGLSALAAAIQSGAGPTIVLGLSRDTARLELAREFGADYTIDVEKEDPVEAVAKILPDGADAVIETSGTPEGIQAGIKMLRKAGRMVSIGLSGGLKTEIEFDDLVWRSISILCGVGQAGNVEDAMWLIKQDKFPFHKINNTHYKLEQAAQALADTEDPPQGFIKGAIIFD